MDSDLKEFLEIESAIELIRQHSAASYIQSCMKKYMIEKNRFVFVSKVSKVSNEKKIFIRRETEFH